MGGFKDPGSPSGFYFGESPSMLSLSEHLDIVAGFTGPYFNRGLRCSILLRKSPKLRSDYARANIMADNGSSSRVSSGFTA
jgi:hypothetical protein